MSANILKNIQQLKQKQQQRHSKQNVTITNLSANKLVQSKPIIRVMPSPMIVPISVVSVVSVVSEPIVKPTIVESLPDFVVAVSTIVLAVPTIVVSVPDIVVSVVEPDIVVSVVEPDIVVSVVEPDIIIEESANINNNFNLQYIKSKIMTDYSNLYKTA